MRQWERYIRSVEPYVPGEQPQGKRLVKLNTNENPYPPSPEVLQALAKLEQEYDRLRKYPDPAAEGLVSVLAGNYQLEPEQIFVGVGSDDVLAMAFMTFFNSDKPILFPEISYSFYPVWAELFRIPYETPALDEDMRIMKEDYYKDNGGVVFPNPNAPTGLLMPLAEVEDIILHNQDVVVMIDEAYIDFGGASARSLLDKYDNLLVIQTFSKSRSLAGMRIGYAMGHRDLIKAIQNVKYSYNSYTMNLPSQVAGMAAAADQDYFHVTLKKIIKTREMAKQRLQELGFTFPDSMSNFIFATHPHIAAETLYEGLKARQIYVRYFNKPKLDQYLRISIGTDEEMEYLYEVLKELVQSCVNNT